MKFSKKLTKFLALAAIGTMLLGVSVSATTPDTAAQADSKDAVVLSAENKDVKDAIINAVDVKVKQGETFDPMDYVVAIDNGGDGEDITDKVRVSGEVDTDTPGKYEITYKVKGSNGNRVTETITVTVKEKKNQQKDAVITASDVTIKQGSTFDPLKGVSAKDNDGNGSDLTSDIKVSNKVDTNKPGKYNVTYSVTGANCVQVTKTITVTVVANDTTSCPTNTTKCPTNTTAKDTTCNTTAANTTCNTTAANTTCNTTAANTTCNTTAANTTCNTTAANTTCNTTAANTTCNTTAANTTCNTTAANTTCNTTAANTTCNTTSANTTCNTTAVNTTKTIGIKVDPIKVVITKPECNTTDVDDENTMKATGANTAELGLSVLGLLGAAITTFIKRK